MKMPARALSSALITAALSFGVIGCATYKYAEQNDSASVRGTAPGFFHQMDVVRLSSIDGARIGLVWSADSASSVAPGRHVIAVVTLYEIADGVPAPEFTMIEADFTASHSYRFSLAETGSGSIDLWDETSGADTHLLVGTWEIGGQELSYDEPISSVDFKGAQHARPPLYAGNPGGKDKHGPPSSHPGGPPSIPHSPRPNPGGGGGSHGGGGGGSRGGGGGGGKK